MAQSPTAEFTFRPKLRLCQVGDELGYFHTWEQVSSVLDPSPLRGGHPGGTVAQMYAIVEFADGVKRVQPYEIKFVDEQNDILKTLKSGFKTVKATKELLQVKMTGKLVLLKRQENNNS